MPKATKTGGSIAPVGNVGEKPRTLSDDVVRQVVDWDTEGLVPDQIADRLKAKGVPIPTDDPGDGFGTRPSVPLHPGMGATWWGGAVSAVLASPAAEQVRAELAAGDSATTTEVREG